MPSPRSNTPPNFRPPTQDAPPEEAAPERQDESFSAPISDIDLVAMGGDQRRELVDSGRDLRFHLGGIIFGMDSAIRHNANALTQTEEALGLLFGSHRDIQAARDRLLESQNGLIQFFAHLEAHLYQLEQAVNVD